MFKKDFHCLFGAAVVKLFCFEVWTISASVAWGDELNQCNL